MQINNHKHITMNSKDVKDAIIQYLYHNQGLSGIFKVEFKVTNNTFDSAEVTVDLNEKQ